MDITATMYAGSIEYSLDAAKVKIDDMIAALESAKADGAEFVVGLSGNYRGAQYVRLSTDLGWSDDEDGM